MGSKEFPVYAQGQLRELFLSVLRDGLRSTVNPDTNEAWTEEEIQLATSPGTSEFARATALDLLLFSAQNQAPWLADQIVIRRASREWLQKMHAPGTGSGDPLPASGGGGVISAPVTGSALFVGSTTIPDPIAHYLTDDGGRRYQVLFDATATGPGTVKLTVKATSGGTVTNLAAGTKLHWGRAPSGVSADATVVERFRGGRPAESTGDYADRIESDKRHRRGAGNSAEWRSWARKVSTAIQEVFVYPCGRNAGSVVLCALARRDVGNKSNTARIADSGTLAILTARLTPPGAPDVPACPSVLVVTGQPVEANMLATLRMPRGRGRGWADSSPWPRSTGGEPVKVVEVTSQTLFKITLPSLEFDDPEPGQIPRLMIWDTATTTFVPLSVASWSTVPASPGTYSITLASAPSVTIGLDSYVSPEALCLSELEAGVRAYFDSLGTGELVADTDLRSGRAARFPLPEERWSNVVGSTIVDYLKATAPGLVSAGSAYVDGSDTVGVPTNVADGPLLHVSGQFGVYPQE